MAIPKTTDFLTGVIEGFYGTPWTREERLELFDWMSHWGLNSYFYGPKDDLNHRARWREPYSTVEAEALQEIIRASRGRGLHFIYALGPGLDIRYSRLSDVEALKRRFEQIRELGCGDFCLLFDDIPDLIDPADQQRWGSFASAQAGVANELFRWIRERQPEARFLFCPTPYCGRMASRQHGGADYLAIIGRELFPEIEVFWTGPEIISRQITVSQIRELQTLLRREPLIWDNLHANDYDGHRFFCGPYSGRSRELRAEVSGILVNPNTEFSLNRVPLQTFSEFVKGQGEWNPRAAYLSAMQEWLPRFATVGTPVRLEDLILLGDCYYLPFELGPEAREFFALTQRLVARDPAEWKGEAAEFLQRASRLRELCVRMTELHDRPLFHALSRRIWELREELELLERYVKFRSEPANLREPFRSDFHQPMTYRGGMVAGLQKFLIQHADGTLTPRDPSDEESVTARLQNPS